jgi:SpoVK/Ycf46/Vps4 family AAA+-type ATPase
MVEGRTRLSREDIAAAARAAEGQGLGALAQPMADPVLDDALVVPAALRSDLEALATRCRVRDTLTDALGPAARTRYHPGVRALFVGPSGTGKTLAASWLATKLGIPMYRIDLAAVTSKYIGETEKNLAQLIARAEHAEVGLLFDEADSLFGKRTDVKDSNDRFANAQTNYLLQRIESFEGITVLTSNSRARFDSAFTRRLDAIIEFPLPAPEERRALWLAHLGEKHSLQVADINRLAAACDLAGGHIRNAVLAAAVTARAAQRAIAYADVVAGVAAECRKLGKQAPHGLAQESTP